MSRYIETKFGMKTRSVPNPLVTEVETTVTQILQNNPDRLSYTIVNLGDYSVYVAWDREVADDRGVLIAASGGSLSLTADEDGELVSYPLYGIADTANCDIFSIVTEGA